MQPTQPAYDAQIIYNAFPGLNPLQKEQIAGLYPLYLDRNAKINVVSRKDIDKLYLHHVLHSLAIARFLELSGKGNLEKGARIMDVGTGGGFPGIPLAILFPQAEFLLVDSIGKKIKVAGEIAAATGLSNVKALKTRAEEVTGTFDYIVSRAVTDMGNFLPWVQGKYTKGIIYLKGGDLSKGGALDKEMESALSKAGINRKSITVCDIDLWFKDEFFKEKKVIYIPR